MLGINFRRQEDYQSLFQTFQEEVAKVKNGESFRSSLYSYFKAEKMAPLHEKELWKEGLKVLADSKWAYYCSIPKKSYIYSLISRCKNAYRLGRFVTSVDYIRTRKENLEREAQGAESCWHSACEDHSRRESHHFHSIMESFCSANSEHDLSFMDLFSKEFHKIDLESEKFRTDLLHFVEVLLCPFINAKKHDPKKSVDIKYEKMNCPKGFPVLHIEVDATCSMRGVIERKSKVPFDVYLDKSFSMQIKVVSPSEVHCIFPESRFRMQRISPDDAKKICDSFPLEVRALGAPRAALGITCSTSFIVHELHYCFDAQRNQTFVEMEDEVIVPEGWGGEDVADAQKSVDKLMRENQNYSCIAESKAPSSWTIACIRRKRMVREFHLKDFPRAKACLFNKILRVADQGKVRGDQGRMKWHEVDPDQEIKRQEEVDQKWLEDGMPIKGLTYSFWKAETLVSREKRR